MTSPTDRFLSALANHGCHPKQNGKDWSARCPAHDDRRPSLSISEGRDGQALVHCHAGCLVEDVCNALELRVADLMPEQTTRIDSTPPAAREQQAMSPLTVSNTYRTAEEAIQALETTHGKRTAQWSYHDEDGRVIGVVLRWDTQHGKEIRPLSLRGNRWVIGGMEPPRPLYRLPELKNSTDVVFVCEGEKCVEAMQALGFSATTSPHGCQSGSKTDWAPLAGREVVLVPDNDTAGEKYVDAVAEILTQLEPPPTVRILGLPDLPEKGDIVNFVSAQREVGKTNEEIRAGILELLAAAQEIRGANSPSPWPEIQDIEQPHLPPFPVHVLPPTLQDWVLAEAEATQTPPDLPALLGLSVCSSAIARKFTCVPWAGWIEPTNLYAAVLLGPGNRKSAVFRDATRPLRDYENALIERERPKIERERAERRQLAQRVKSLEKKAADKDDNSLREEAAEMSVQLANWPEPVFPKLLIDDATDEKLELLLAQQGGRLASMSAEGGVFDILAGRYSKSGCPAFTTHLKAHSGDDLRPERVGRETLYCPQPALTCCYAIQPRVLRQLNQHWDAFRGRGLLGRFLYAAPASLLGSRNCRPPTVDAATNGAYDAEVQRLLSLPVPSEPKALSLAPDAETVFLEWLQEIEHELADTGFLEFFRDWGGKLGGATLRLAGVLHCVGHTEPSKHPIGRATMTAAVTIAKYLIPHAIFCLGKMNAHEKPDLADARWLVKWFRRYQKTVFTKREAQRAGQQQFETVEDLEPALKLLQTRGYIREVPTEKKGKGRPPSPTYAVNPAVFEKQDTENPLTILTQPSPHEPKTDFVNSVNESLEPEIEFDGEGGVFL